MNDEQVSIFALVLAGQTSRDIATQLKLDHAHVERVIRAVRQQLGARNRHQAALIIARQQGWPTAQADSPHQHGPIASHIEPKTAKIPTKSVDTNHEHSPFFRYVRDIGGSLFNKELAFDAKDETGGMSDIRTLFASSRITSNLLMIIMIIVSAALSLSALISAMLGLDVLIRY